MIEALAIFSSFSKPTATIFTSNGVIDSGQIMPLSSLFCSIAAATSSALAIASFVIPQNAKALPTADVSQFSRALV